MIGLIKGTARQAKTVSGLPLPIASYKSNSKLPIQALSLSINPTQSGSGDPYPAGGGKNKLPPFTNGTYTQNSIKAVVKDGLITVTGQKDTASGINLTLPLSKTFTLKQNDYLHIRNSNSNASITLSFAGAGWSPAFASTNRIIQYTGADASVTGVTIYFAGTVTEEQNFTFQPSLEVGSAVTDWTPYENIRPITGVSSVNVTRTGKNIIGGYDWAYGWRNAHGYSIDTTAKTVKWDRSGSFYRPDPIYPFKPNTQYSFLFTYTSSGENNCLYISYTDGTTDVARVLPAMSTKGTTIIKSNASKTVSGFDLGWRNNTAMVTCYYEECGVFEGNISASDFEPYTGNTYLVQLGNTYYGATLDVVSGKLTIKYVKTFVDKTMLKSYNSSNMVFATSGGKRIVRMRSFLYYTTTGAKEGYYCRAIKWAGEIFCISNIFSNIHINNRGYMSSQTWTDFVVPDTVTDYASWQSFIQDLIDNNVDVEFCYEYSTADTGYPTEVQLSPTQVNSLLGSNNIWHDGNGDVEVLKFMDRQLYFGR